MTGGTASGDGRGSSARRAWRWRRVGWSWIEGAGDGGGSVGAVLGRQGGLILDPGFDFLACLYFSGSGVLVGGGFVADHPVDGVRRQWTTVPG